MADYHNENDPYTAQWLQNLMAEGLIPPGDIDDRSIKDVRPGDLKGYTRCHFFSGISGWPLALQIAGWPDNRPVWTGSCPCQPFSCAGAGEGEADPRHLWPVWCDLIRECEPPVIFGEQVASALGRRWLAGVRTDLEAMAYRTGGADLCAAGAGAPHIRQRLIWVADPARFSKREPLNKHATFASGREARKEPGGRCELDGMADADRTRLEIGRCFSSNAGEKCEATQRDRETGGLADPDGRNACAEGQQRSGQYGQFTQDGRYDRRLGDSTSEQAWNARQPWERSDAILCRDGKTRRIESGTFPLAHGVPARMGKLRAWGNAINPQIVAHFIQSYCEIREEEQKRWVKSLRAYQTFIESSAIIRT